MTSLHPRHVSRAYYVLSLYVAILLCTFSSAVASDFQYVTTQLTHNNYGDTLPQINDRGHVVWQGLDGSDWEIFLYNGSTITKLTDNNHNDKYPQINNNGYVVWEQRGNPYYEFAPEIFLYDGTTITRLTDNQYGDYRPQINVNGHVVWHGYDGGRDTEIFLYDGTTVTQLTDNDFFDESPRISDNGNVVWFGQDVWEINEHPDAEIFLYDGMTITQLTDNDYNDYVPQINENGHVVWPAYDGPDSKMFLYDGMTITQLTGSDYHVAYPEINIGGSVVWRGPQDANTEADIFLYDEMTITQLTNNNYLNRQHKINNSGYVVWSGGDPNSWQPDIFLYDGTATRVLTPSSYPNYSPQINSHQQVVWYGSDTSDTEIYIARPGVVRIVPELTKIPWWKSEEYWGSWDPRIPLSPPHGVDIPEIGPEPLPCPECVFSRVTHRANMPSHLPDLYQSANQVFGKAAPTRPLGPLQKRITTHLESISAGQRYDKATKASVIKAIHDLEGMRGDASPEPGELLQAINSIELDWRIPPLTPQEVRRGGNRSVDFSGVARVTFKERRASGRLSLRIDADLPAYVAEPQPLWPVASYQFESTGRLGGQMDVSFYFGGYVLRGHRNSLHILEWDGETYKDITTVVNWPAKTITGRTNRLSTYVIASTRPAPD